MKECFFKALVCIALVGCTTISTDELSADQIIEEVNAYKNEHQTEFEKVKGQILKIIDQYENIEGLRKGLVGKDSIFNSNEKVYINSKEPFLEGGEDAFGRFSHFVFSDKCNALLLKRNALKLFREYSPEKPVIRRMSSDHLRNEILVLLRDVFERDLTKGSYGMYDNLIPTGVTELTVLADKEKKIKWNRLAYSIHSKNIETVFRTKYLFIYDFDMERGEVLNDKEFVSGSVSTTIDVFDIEKSRLIGVIKRKTSNNNTVEYSYSDDAVKMIEGQMAVDKDLYAGMKNIVVNTLFEVPGVIDVCCYEE